MQVNIGTLSSVVLFWLDLLQKDPTHMKQNTLGFTFNWPSSDLDINVTLPHLPIRCATHQSDKSKGCWKKDKFWSLISLLMKKSSRDTCRNILLKANNICIWCKLHNIISTPDDFLLKRELIRLMMVVCFRHGMMVLSGDIYICSMKRIHKLSALVLLYLPVSLDFQWEFIPSHCFQWHCYSVLLTHYSFSPFLSYLLMFLHRFHHVWWASCHV